MRTMKKNGRPTPGNKLPIIIVTKYTMGYSNVLLREGTLIERIVMIF